MSKSYIHQLNDWPDFAWSAERLADALGAVRYAQGRLAGQLEAVGFSQRAETVLRTLTLDVVKTSEIEGEHLDPVQVRSSLARRLGMDAGGLRPSDRNVEGIVAVLVDATTGYAEPLTAERLFDWHRDLFPTGRNAFGPILVGQWRDDHDGPMQVVSGAIGHEHVHYEAPAAGLLEAEMSRFLDWFNSDASTDLLLKAGLAHLWFVTVHPFEDGNGRIARAIADMVLARAEANGQRAYSMSTQIRAEHTTYYQTLEWTQKGSLDVTVWLGWFLACLLRAVESAEEFTAQILQKARFWESASQVDLNARERKILNRLLDDFQGNLTTSKYAQLAKCSAPTALRDITHLVAEGLLTRNEAGGRSTSYSLNFA